MSPAARPIPGVLRHPQRAGTGDYGDAVDDAELDRRLEAARARCTRFLGWPGPRSPRDVLHGLLDGLPHEDADLYGEGGAVEELESEVAALLGKPAAVFAPTGTMAQQVALRVHADRSGCRTVAFHPTAHVELHEGRGYAHLHGLVARLLGDRRALVELADLEAVHEPLGALLLELPQREIGGALPEWDDLVAQTSWARDRGVAVHLDGARLWECLPAYGRPAADVATLFDTVYVSFYKGLGALAGAALAGSEGFVADARTWLRRHGGNLVTSWPYAASALLALRSTLPRMGAYAEHARALADALDELEGAEVLVPPRTPLFHLRLGVDRDTYRCGRLAVAEEQQLWLPGGSPSESASCQLVEVSVSERQLEVSPDDARAALQLAVSAGG